MSGHRHPPGAVLSRDQDTEDAVDRAQVRAALEKPFQVVLGKGGVGRSVVAAALALRASHLGKRVLLLEVNAPDSTARLLGVAPAPDDPREALNNLWICRMTPTGAMREYALLVIKFKAVYHVVFENRLVKYLLRSIPSLGEFTMLGKAWYHATERRPDGRPRFDQIIIDAPATGHALTFLSGARAVADTVPAGPMKSEAERMAALVEDPRRACFHLVTLPEEMPVSEARELYRAARDRVRMHPGLGIMNRMRARVFSAAEERLVAAVHAEADPVLAPYAQAAAREVRRHAAQEGYRREFQALTSGPVVVLPELEEEDIGPRELELLLRALDAAAGTDSLREVRDVGTS